MRGGHKTSAPTIDRTGSLGQMAGQIILCLTFITAIILWSSAAWSVEDPRVTNPSHADWFKPNTEQSTGLDAWGPGQGPVRKDSTADDIHAKVPGFSPGRRCLSCHEGQDENLHYERTKLVCRTCHGTGIYEGIRNPASVMYQENRHKVCATCHEGATASFATYMIHEPSPLAAETRVDFPALYWATLLMVILAGTVFAVFLPYTALWAVRDIGQWMKRKQAKDVMADGASDDNDASHVHRLNTTEALFHTVLVITFMILSITGLAWMMIESPLGQALASLFGDYHGAILIHRIVGLVMLAFFVLHIVYLASRVDWSNPVKSFASPGSIAWKPSDFKNFWQHLLWVLGRGDAPDADRWAWWQKFDYWAVWWGLIIVGTTGIALYDPVATSTVMPGWFLNVARWIHKIEALLAMGHIFIVHFYIESFRPQAFPVNLHGFHGRQDMVDAKDHHGAWVERLKAEGRWDAHKADAPPVLVRVMSLVFGLGSVIVGLALLILTLIFVL